MKSESRVSIVQLHASLAVAVAVLQKSGIADSNSNKLSLKWKESLNLDSMSGKVTPSFCGLSFQDPTHTDKCTDIRHSDVYRD